MMPTEASLRMPLPGRLVVTPMTLADLREASEIEAAAFARTWPRATFANDLTREGGAAYWILRLERPILERGASYPDDNLVMGFLGLQMLYDEMHILTVAVHPRWQRRGLGRLLVGFALRHAIAVGAARTTLEVRATNIAAQNLYRSLGFQSVGERKGYYADNGEDAVIMTTPPFADETWQGPWKQSGTGAADVTGGATIDEVDVTTTRDGDEVDVTTTRDGD